MAKTLVFTTALCALMGACTASRPPEPTRYVAPPVSRPAAIDVPQAASPATAPSHATKLSLATTPKMYRVDGAHHLYDTYPERIYKGKLPPLMHAVVVTEIELDAAGNVRDIQMLRVPSHAPEVVVKIREMIRAASPLPAPQRMGGTHYTDIWLVDKSGRFQLDTLTEGQL